MSAWPILASFSDKVSIPKKCVWGSQFKFIRGFGKKVIQERREAVLRGDDIPHDVLTSILSLEGKESRITDEDLVDAFDTFFIGGVYLALCKANMRVVVGLATRGL